jgi:CubicO group peptidase (beta-lactamase class C family)
MKHGEWLTTLFLCLAAGASPVLGAERASRPPCPRPAYPGTAWKTRQPGEVGLSPARLEALRRLVGGRGCVVRHGYLAYHWGDQAQTADLASAAKPVLSTLLLLAVQEGRLRGVDDPVADFEPRLKALNGGKDRGITWRHLACQTSGYGLTEPPGQAYAYNDFALALYYDVLTGKVFRQKGTPVLKTRLAGALQFQDRSTFDAFGPKDRSGRLALSVRDLARFGLLILRGGRWKDKQIVRPELLKSMFSHPVAAGTPLTAGRDAAMLPRQRSLGGGKNITRVGPGYYSFNWWLNAKDRRGKRLYGDAPPDTVVACGHGGMRMLWVIPSLDLVVAWNEARVEDHDASPADPQTTCNRAARLLREAVHNNPAQEGPGTPFAPRTRVSLVKGKWHLNGTVTYRRSRAQGLLLNVRMVNAVFEDRRRPGFDAERNTRAFIARVPAYVAHGVRGFTLGLQGGFPGYEGAVNSAFRPDGSLRPSYLRRVRRAVEACDRQGAVVILGCYYQRQAHVLKDEAAVRAGVVNVARWLRSCGFTNVVLEITNEFGHQGFHHRLLRAGSGQVQLLGLAKKTHPDLLVSTSGLGGGTMPREVARAADFLLIHFNGTRLADIPVRVKALKEFGKPIVCNEDAKTGHAGAKAAELCVAGGASWGLMVEKVNQHYPFSFRGASDDKAVYAALKKMTSP